MEEKSSRVKRTTDWLSAFYIFLLLVYMISVIATLYGESLGGARFYHCLMRATRKIAYICGSVSLEAEQRYWSEIETHRLAD